MSLTAERDIRDTAERRTERRSWEVPRLTRLRRVRGGETGRRVSAREAAVAGRRGRAPGGDAGTSRERARAGREESANARGERKGALPSRGRAAGARA